MLWQLYFIQKGWHSVPKCGSEGWGRPGEGALSQLCFSLIRAPTPFDYLKSRFSFLLADSAAHTFFFSLAQVPCLSHAGPITGKRPVIIIALYVYWCKFAIVTSKRRQGNYKDKAI